MCILINLDNNYLTTYCVHAVTNDGRNEFQNHQGLTKYKNNVSMKKISSKIGY